MSDHDQPSSAWHACHARYLELKAARAAVDAAREALDLAYQRESDAREAYQNAWHAWHRAYPLDREPVAYSMAQDRWIFSETEARRLETEAPGMIAWVE